MSHGGSLRGAGVDAHRASACPGRRWALAVSALLLAACGPGVRGEVLATTSIFAAGLTQDADFLYWRTEDALVRLPKAGGSPEVLVGGQKPVANTLSADRLFWLNDDGGNVSLRSAAIGGGDERVLDADENGGGRIFRNLATDGSFLYWSNEAQEIRRAPVGGGDAVPIALVDTPASSVAVLDGVVFATTRISIARFQGGSVAEFLGGGLVPDHVTFASPLDDFFYWVERGNGAAIGAVFRAARDGSEGALIADREVAPSAPFSDGVHVYYAAGGQEGRIRRVRATGGRDPEDFSGGAGDPIVDGTHVYWIDLEGNVHKAPK